MSNRNTPAFLLAFARVDLSAPAAVLVSQDGGVLSLTSTTQTDFTLTLEPFAGDAVEVVATPETPIGLPAPQTCAVIIDGAAGTVRVVADRGTSGARVSVRQVAIGG